jgi:hypothetical protein
MSLQVFPFRVNAFMGIEEIFYLLYGKIYKLTAFTHSNNWQESETLMEYNI